MKVKLQHVAHARSGDKGNTANIEVFAYAPELYPHLKEQLTAARVQASGACFSPKITIARCLQRRVADLPVIEQRRIDLAKLVCRAA